MTIASTCCRMSQANHRCRIGFEPLDPIMARTNSTRSYLTQQFAAINNASGKNGLRGSVATLFVCAAGRHGATLPRHHKGRLGIAVGRHAWRARTNARHARPAAWR
ncbi:hypothetical protein AB4156_27495, partial [Cupriavidus sp. 2MCAB6]|uniref:hypothetical protein n=1 Tax=Cupriavidus sp. 2MCAB6 TaxID=3232981 RepID=UPI003F92F0D6